MTDDELIEAMWRAYIGGRRFSMPNGIPAAMRQVLIGGTMSTQKCRLCGRSVHEIKGWLERVNAKGEAAIMECRPACYPLRITPEHAVLGAILGEASNESKG
jgi:hypothetical protein